MKWEQEERTGWGGERERERERGREKKKSRSCSRREEENKARGPVQPAVLLGAERRGPSVCSVLSEFLLD